MKGGRIYISTPEDGRRIRNGASYRIFSPRQASNCTSLTHRSRFHSSADPHARTGHRPTIAAAAWVVLAGGDAVNARQQQFSVDLVSSEMRNSMTRRRRRPLTVAFIDPRPLTASYISRRIARVGNTTGLLCSQCPRTTGVPTLKMFTPLQSALPAEKIHRLAPAQISYQHIRPYWAFTRSDRRTDRSVRLVCPIGRSDDRIV